MISSAKHQDRSEPIANQDRKHRNAPTGLHRNCPGLAKVYQSMGSRGPPAGGKCTTDRAALFELIFAEMANGRDHFDRREVICAKRKQA
jgi:hypothetical protein